MGKRGACDHLKRIAVPTAVPIRDKKAATWIVRPSAGPHSKECMALGVLLRDILKVAATMKEAKNILDNRMVVVDGLVRTDVKFPVGLMDIVTVVPEKKSYRIVVDWKGRLVPMEVKGDDTGKKILRVVNKNIIEKGKINLTFHDGRNIQGDNHIKVGDSVVLQLPKGVKEKAKILQHLKLEKGARCLVREGKHAGTAVNLKEIVKRKGRKSEAVV